MTSQAVAGQATASQAVGQPATPVIDVRGLCKAFGGRPVVRDVSLTVARGRITGFLGPNGAGKTTCMRLLCGLLTADAGEGHVLGHDFRADQPLIKRQTGYMTQKFSLYDDLTIEENLLFMARIRELNNRPQRVAATLERLGLTHRCHQLAGTLSGGWKQRLALAVAVLHEPQLLLLDEPTAGVDPKARREFWDTIHLLAGQGLTVLVSTHYMDEAERCHDIGYMLDGSLLARGTPEELIASSGLHVLAGHLRVDQGQAGEGLPAGPSGDGQSLSQVASALHTVPGVLAATLFGTVLRVVGTDAVQLHHAVEPFSGVEWREAAPTLEDVFIHLVGGEAGRPPGQNLAGHHLAGPKLVAPNMADEEAQA